MLQIKEQTPLNLFLKAFIEVYKLKTFQFDPKNYKDTSAVLSLIDYKLDPGVFLKDNSFYSNFDYNKYIIDGKQQMRIEIDHYNKEFIESGKIKSLINLFHNDSFTKRGVISLWDNFYLDINNSFPCIIYIWFRRDGKVLHMNCHMRANDAYKIFLMDLHIATSIHTYVSKKLKLRRGNYHHFVDSFHFYKKDKKEINQLYNRLIK